MSNKLKNTFICMMMLFFIVMLLIYSKDTARTIKHCIEICTDVLIPSVFAYMILCTFLISSGLSEIIVTPLWYLSKRFIKLDKKLFSVFVLSAIAGYPVGTKMLKEIISQNKNYTEIAKRITPFCYASGPAFIIGIAGNIVYNSITAGMIIFISCTMGNLAGMIFITRKEHISPTLSVKADINGKILSSVFFSSAKAILLVCLSMIVFNIAILLITCFIDSTLLESELFYYIKAIMEITNIYTLDAATPLWLMTFLISFGGLCVIFQIYLISDGYIELFRFVIMRLTISATSAVICFVITKIIGFEASLPTVAVKTPQLMLSNPVVLFSVGCMTLIVIAFFYDQIKIFKKF